ncbi:nitrite reductase large subunit NirB [Leekyejoonella antrihumi]|uniref:assimilatory sulfite reductase (ferredoxin) n=1 Tax=Leekyejoonella antrihumi TaxID=1660198 RepID=A0A563E9S3_9MICO|nr:nitrite reductase large subunit NirB [Leekyejoonella antrihumi]TWP39002.1 nitrite reductase large subunit [Leekyejoonella antrihumi]
MPVQRVDPTRIVVVGAGMVAQRLVEALHQREQDRRLQVTVIGDEPRHPYDRVALTSYFTGRDPEQLRLGDAGLWDEPTVLLRKGVRVVQVDREAQEVELGNGERVAYDQLVLATGSVAAVPPVRGADLRGCFVYRTIDDVADLRGYVEQLRTRRAAIRGVVVGGGLLGLEAAGALRALDVESTVVEFAPRLMPMQVDEGGGEQLRRLVEELGVRVRTGTATEEVRGAREGRVTGMRFADGEGIDADVVIFATGVRPRDELARAAGLAIGERGGVVVDSSCRTEDPSIHAIGEVACIDGVVWGLVAPGYAMAEVVADRLLGGSATFPGADSSTKLKLLEVDVASFGDAHATEPGCLEVVYADPVAGTYQKLVVSDDARVLRGGVLVGDTAGYPSLRAMLGRRLDEDPSAYIAPQGRGGAKSLDLADDAPVCSCNNVTAGTIRAAVSDGGCQSLGDVKRRTRAGTSCGSCLPLVKKLVETEQQKAGVTVSKELCEHFRMSRAQLFDAVRVTGTTTFSEIISRHGRGRGCDLCKPVVASILASLGNGHILDGEQGALQDTNDHMLANLQKDGTYSVVPRIPGGEITPEGLIAIGEIARDFDLYTKITGGQRIDLLGATIDQLPLIWRRLVDAGFESGHAYGKSLRTVKSCVGAAWCRYGVQDSTGLAIRLELRYRGLRSPHKLKLGVSGCARECAEARSKDVGLIATEDGWNVYVGGNGGFTPRHAQLFAESLSEEEVVRTIDRFFMYYIRTADRLQRTAAWLDDVEGGLDHVKDVVLRDSLGLAADLDAAMERHVADYGDEWSEVLADPERLSRFTTFVNDGSATDHSQVYVVERGQRRPASAHERVGTHAAELFDAARRPVLVAGPELQVRS